MNSKKNQIVILYTELALYFTACLEELQKQTDAEIHVFRTEAIKEAPFKFTIQNENIHLYNEAEYSLKELVAFIKPLNPVLIYCAGWSNMKFIRAVYHSKNKNRSLLGLDNKWENKSKQKLLASLAKPFFRKIFKYAFVPGTKQIQFASKLGFEYSNIIRNAYSADYNHFTEIANKILESKKNNFPKKFLFIGRYIELKGIYDLWDAFIELQEEVPNSWELWCLGTGNEYENRTTHPKIKHFGFIQPKDFQEYLANTGVYILPSHFEPWGVSVHEMAIAGFPMILSDEIGAGEIFLIDQENGFSFPAKNKESLKKSMKRIIQMDNKQLIKMSEKSLELSKTITPKKWAQSLIENIIN